MLVPRYVWGYLSPLSIDAVRRDGYEFYRLVPSGVMQVVVPLGGSAYTSRVQVEEALDKVLPPLVDRLAAERPDHITLGGVPIAALAGRARVQALLKELHERTGIRVNNPLEAAIEALHHLKAPTVVLASRWSAQVNDAIKTYLAEGGIELVGATERGLAPAAAVDIREGWQMSLDLGREAAQAHPDAAAIFVPGGAALSLHVVPMLEKELGRPVLTNLTIEVWEGLIRPGVVRPIEGWGRLLAG